MVYTPSIVSVGSSSSMSNVDVKNVYGEFVKEKDGVKAPAGFHYMSNGKLMSDADHIAMHGYVEKRITSVDINTKDIHYLGETRSFSIQGDNGGVFSLEIYDNSTTPVYYNFDTGEWTTTKSGLNNIELAGSYNFSVIFPVFVANGYGTTRTFNIDLHAKVAGNIKTKHPNYIEVKNLDGSININRSIGSNSDLLRKTISQMALKTLELSCIAPSLTSTSTDVTVGSVSGNIIHTTVASPQDKIAIGDKITGTGALAASHILVTDIDPNNNDPNEIEVNQSCTISSGVTLAYDPAFGSMTPNGLNSSAGAQGFKISSGGGLKKNFSITCRAVIGRTMSAFRVPTTDDICVYTTVDFESAALAISGENTSSDSLFYRWPIDNIAGLQEGMILDPARADNRNGLGANTTTPTSISKYSTTATSAKLVERKHYTDIESTTISDVSVKGVDNYNNDVTAVDRNGLATAQKGNITFDVQQGADSPKNLESVSGVRIFAYGSSEIKSLTGMDVAISNVVITPTQISTTTTAAVANSTTIPVTDTSNISTASTIRGPGIDSSVANPTVSFKSTATLAGNLTASSAQTLESGQTLYFDNASNILTITGTIEVSNMPLSDTTLYLDVERFLSAR